MQRHYAASPAYQVVHKALSERKRHEREAESFRWVQTRQGAWVLSQGVQHGTLRLVPDGDAMWQVMQRRCEAKPTCVAEGLQLAYAQG